MPVVEPKTFEWGCFEPHSPWQTSNEYSYVPGSHCTGGCALGSSVHACAWRRRGFGGGVAPRNHVALNTGDAAGGSESGEFRLARDAAPLEFGPRNF